MARLLVIDKDVAFCELMEHVGTLLHVHVAFAATLAEGLALGASGVDVVLLEKNLPDADGITCLGDVQALKGAPTILIATEFGNADIAERALRAGAWDFLCKPLQAQEILLLLQQVLLHRQGRCLEQSSACDIPLHVDDNENILQREGLVGTSPSFLAALTRAQEAARSETNVLIYGETGAGKELFARLVHINSRRRKETFVTVDCAALTENLVESHLFGHARGAFTGADKAKEGLLLTANGGTLFLDEMGELPLSIQKVFLRALELRRFRPVGAVEEVPSNFRLIAATNKDLSHMVKQKLFRDDLLYRLQGVTIRIPPLRERKEDIVPLAEYAIRNFCQNNSLPIKTLNASCLKALQAYTWPGNVRELINTVERACIVAKDELELFAVHLPTDMRVAIARERVQEDTRSATPIMQGALFLATDEGTPSLKEWKKYTEETYLQRLMQQHKGDIRACATKAGVSRGHFYELLKKHGISP